MLLLNLTLKKKRDKETILEKSIKSARGGDTAALGQLITLLQAEDKSEKQILSILKNKGLIKGLWNSHTINEYVEIFIKSETEKAEQAAKAKAKAEAKAKAKAKKESKPTKARLAK